MNGLSTCAGKAGGSAGSKQLKRRFTIERLRTLVLVTGVLLVAALGVFLVRGKWRNPLNLKELPKRLGVDIQSDATGFTLEHALGAHGRYKIHASKAVQFKQGKAELHDVKIELYSDDGQSVDRIEGAEFEYDQKNGTATAAGPVEITLAEAVGGSAISAEKAAVDKGTAEKAQGRRWRPSSEWLHAAKCM